MGTTWTIGALTAWAFGIPLKLPYGVSGNGYKGSNFLPHAVGVFDIMEQNGYVSHFVLGSDCKFSGKNNLFKNMVILPFMIICII